MVDIVCYHSFHVVKPNRTGIYELFTEIYTIKLLKAFNCKIANKIFIIIVKLLFVMY